MMKKMKWLAGVVAIVASMSGLAFAGLKASAPVVINTSNRSAIGAMGTASNSTDPNQWIGCEVVSYPSGYIFGYCMAQTAGTPAAASNSASCYFTSAAIVSAVGALTPDSLISFSWDANGNCLSVGIVSASDYETKH